MQPPRGERRRKYVRDYQRAAYRKNPEKGRVRARDRRAEHGDEINCQRRARAGEQRELEQTAKWSAYMHSPPNENLPAGGQLRMWLEAKMWAVYRLAREMEVSAFSVFGWLSGQHLPTGKHQRKLYEITQLECFRPKFRVAGRTSLEINAQRRRGYRMRLRQRYVANLNSYRENPELVGEKELKVCLECGFQAKSIAPHVLAEHSESLLRWYETRRPKKLRRAAAADDPQAQRKLVVKIYRLRWGYKQKASLASSNFSAAAAERLRGKGGLNRTAAEDSYMKMIEVLNRGTPLGKCAKQLGWSLSKLHRNARAIGWDTSAHLKSRTSVTSYLFNLRRHICATPSFQSAEQLAEWHQAQQRSDSTGLFREIIPFLPALTEELRRPGTIKALAQDHKNVMGLTSSILKRPRAGSAPVRKAFASPRGKGGRHKLSPEKQKDFQITEYIERISPHVSEIWPWIVQARQRWPASRERQKRDLAGRGCQPAEIDALLDSRTSKAAAKRLTAHHFNIGLKAVQNAVLSRS